jgi:N6-L-threonylcarbamoyladenine synthase
MAERVVLGIETSCDETGLAVVVDGQIRSNVVASQVEIHSRFGGVVPEVAARAHVESIKSLAHRALAEAEVHPNSVSAVAATQGPGLAGALVVGFSFGKAMAWTLGAEFVGVDHMEGHLLAPMFQHEAYSPPAVVLLASGGHSQIVHVSEWGAYEIMGGTIDDAAGEAFDKLARFLGLGFPGGPAVDRLSTEGDPSAIKFPRALPNNPYDFSFSGLKTSVINWVNKQHGAGIDVPVADVAASMQEAIVDVLVAKTFNAVDETSAKTVAGGGGVLANRRLRMRLQEEADRRGVTMALPTPDLCTDNGAMIALAGEMALRRGFESVWTGDVDAGMRLGHSH